MSPQALMTAEQFAQLETAETEDFELVEGELIPLSGGTPDHARIRDQILAALLWYLRDHRVGEAFGELDCRLTPATVRRPDVSFFLISSSRAISGYEVPVPFAPDIAIEVLSASEKAVDVNRKVRDYLNAGVREVWVFDRENSEVFVSTIDAIRVLRSGSVLQTPLLEGFSLPLGDLLGGR